MLVQIRDFEYSPEAQESRKQELEKLVQDQESLRSSLLQWCFTSYGEVTFLLLFPFLYNWYSSEKPVGKIIWGGLYKGWYNDIVQCSSLFIKLSFLPVGFQLLDALFCCACLCRKYSKIWSTTFVFGKSTFFWTALC